MSRLSRKQLTTYLMGRGFIKLPMFRKIIIMTAPDGKTVSRDFYVEEKVVNVISASNSQNISDAISVKTSDYDVEVVITDSFLKTKNELKLLAEREQLSVFWVDKEMLEEDADDEGVDTQDAFCLEGLRKWIYCPVIAEAYNEWIELTVKDVGSLDEQGDENDGAIKCSDIEFDMRDVNVLPDVVKQQFNLDVEGVLSEWGLPQDEVYRQTLSATIIVIQSISDNSIDTSKFAHRVINALRMTPEAKVFLQYHAQTINWHNMKLDEAKDAMPVYRIEGLVDFIQSLNATKEEIARVEEKLKGILQALVEVTEKMPGMAFEEKRQSIRIDKQSWTISLHTSNHFDSEEMLVGESPEYINHLIQRLNQMEIEKGKWIDEKRNLYQCTDCDYLQDHSGSCDSCGGKALINRIYASVKGHRYSIQDAVRTMHTKRHYK